MLSINSKGLNMRKFGDGIKEDFARRKKFYLSDWTDGIHYKSLSSSLFLFFAVLAPAVTFGGMLGIYTNGAIGAVELIVSCSVCGVLFAIFSGQPLIILGGTGPILVMTAMLYNLSKQLGLDFLGVYFWVGIWTSLLTIIAAYINLSDVMKFFTRFTDEIFAALISIIFIYESVSSISKYFFGTIEAKHDTAILTLLLAVGTYTIATSIANLRQSRYLNRTTREFLSDFGPIIAISCMTLFAFSMHEVNLDVLPAPDKFGTTTGRSWLVDPWSIPIWARFAAIGPAFFVSILIFLDQNITARLVNSPDHKLKKGEAYHWDMMIVGALIGFCSFFGLPWVVAATVRSLNHVRGLAKFKDVRNQDGEVENKIESIKETRVTGFLIFSLLGATLLILPLIKQVPMAILYGIFLYMGVVSMKGSQFFERLGLWLMDPELYPEKHFTHKAPMKVIHKFTLVQFLALIVLWIVKTSSLGLLFPLFIALLVPLRNILKNYFKPEHLDYLDSEEESIEEEERWL